MPPAVSLYHNTNTLSPAHLFSQIDARSTTPLYAQIATRIKVAIAAGDLAPGAGLPSVRQLASQLRINPATVVQAYRELETEGFVEMKQGAGTFVRQVPERRRGDERSQQAQALVKRMLEEAGRLRISPDELRAALGKLLDGESR
ncbi:MAG: GntR family transcriptional regulator [Gemmatimonadales bacterium]